MNRIPGDIRVTHLRPLTKKWENLRHRPFPSIEQRPDVDNLIEIDKVELHCALGEIKGDSRDSIAWRIPLVWRCMNSIKSNESRVHESNFVR